MSESLESEEEESNGSTDKDPSAVSSFANDAANYQTAMPLMTRRNLSPFTLQFTVNEGRMPSADEKDSLVAHTSDFLANYFSVLFSNVQVTMEFFMVSSMVAPSMQGDMIAVDFEGVAIFGEGVIPTSQDMNLLTRQAFLVDESLDKYLDILQTELLQSNVFASTIAIGFVSAAGADGVASNFPGSNNNNSSFFNNALVALVTILSIMAVGIALMGILVYQQKERHKRKKEDASLAESEALTEDDNASSSFGVESQVEDGRSTLQVRDGTALASSQCDHEEKDSATKDRRFVMLNVAAGSDNFQSFSQPSSSVDEDQEEHASVAESEALTVHQNNVHSFVVDSEAEEGWTTAQVLEETADSDNVQSSSQSTSDNERQDPALEERRLVVRW
jgi:hypothetical protein